MGNDETGTANALRGHVEALRPIIASHGGRIVDTAGDGVLLEFPSIIAAVECAVAAQRLMAERNAGVPEDRRMLYRVGINLGDVIVEGEHILGDGVNVAARLESIAAPGGICLSGAAYQQVRGKVAVDFADLGEQQLKNIALPVRAYAVVMDDAAPVRPTPIRSGSPRLSIVVLPFTNIGGDPEQEYFVDGVTDSLTTDLSRISGSFVIGHNTAFTYKGKHVDLKQIGRELNVRYVLEGSVQRGGNRMRVNIQLIDAGTGNHLWADRFDKPVGDLLDMQDEIVARLAGQLGTQLISAEARRAERAPQPGSMDLYFRGMACLYKGYSPEYMAQARDFFEGALALDPGNIEALVARARVDLLIGASYMTDDRGARLAAAEAALTKVLSLAPEHPVAHNLLGAVQIQTNRAALGIAHCERALALDRNLAFAHASIGLAKFYLGRAEEAESHVNEAFRLSPRDTFAHTWMYIAGLAKLLIGAYDDGVARYRRSIEMNRNYPLAHFQLAAALAHLGRLEEARSAVQAGLALDPTFTIRRFRAAAPSDNPTFLAQRERIYEGMHKAGVPEG